MQTKASVAILLLLPICFMPALSIYDLPAIVNDTNTIADMSLTTYTGVSANTNRSIYLPGETAGLEIVLLNREGSPVTGADVNLEITAPDNVTYSMHGRITETGSGVYETAFDHTGVEGRYCVNVSAVIEGEECFFDTYFLVRSEYDFDIIRTAEGVIDPTVQDRFDAVVDIVSHTDADAVVIRECVPSVFTVFTDADVAYENDTTILTWQRNLMDGRTSVNYSYSVPVECPKLYELGAMEIGYGDRGFVEAGVWYVAVDPEMLTNGDFASDLSSWTVNKNGLSDLVWYNSSSPQYGCVRGYTSGSEDFGTGNISQTFSSNANPSSATLAYKWRKETVSKTPEKQNITVQLVRPNDTVAWSWTNTTKVDPGTTDWYSENKDVTSDIDATGTWKIKLIWDLDNPSGGGTETVADFDDISLDITEAGDNNNTAPSISNVSNSAPTDSQVYINWTTNQSDSDNRVKYSLNSDLSDHTWSGWNNSTNSVNISLTGLSPSTTHYYSAYSYNGTNSSLYSNSSIHSFTTAGSGETTYDFSSGNGTNKWAYRWQAIYPKPPTSNDVPSIQFTPAQYNKIKTNDSDFQSDTADGKYYAAHRFKFDIQESVETITKIYVFWNGKGDNEWTTDGATLYIWNYNDDTYDQLDSTTSDSEVDLTGEKTANFGNYIDTDGNLTILVEQNYYTKSTKYSRIETDYIKVNVTYTAANHPPSVETPKTYNSSLIERYTFEIGENVTIRTNVTDPEGEGDIDAVLIKITHPNLTVMVNNETMTNVSGITNGYIYEYNYTVPEEPASRGYWLVDVYANDTSDDKAAASTFFKVISLNVTVNAGGPYNPGDTVYIDGWVLYANDTPVDQATVELNSTDPDDNVVNCTTIYTDASGYYYTSYALDDTAIIGMYTVETNVTKGNLQQTENATYSVSEVAQPSIIVIVTDKDVYLTTPQIWVDNGVTYYSPRVVNITVLITDEDGLCLHDKNLSVNVTYPNGSVQAVTMNEYDDGFWNGSFTVYHNDPTVTYNINATVTNGVSSSDNSTFDVDRFRCDSSNCHNYGWHRRGYSRGAHNSSAHDAHYTHSPIPSRGGGGCRPCHTERDLDCDECHTNIFRGTHANVSGSTLTDKCNRCHNGYNDSADTGIDKPVPRCNTSGCHGGEHKDKPGYLYNSTHAGNKVDCGYCHNNMHSIFEPGCDLCHKTQDNHSSYNTTGVNCSICHNNATLYYNSPENMLFNGSAYNTSYSTGTNVHSNNLVPSCQDCHGSPQYKYHLGNETEVVQGIAANCTQCHDNVALNYSGSILPAKKVYYTNADIHNKTRANILPNQTLVYNDNCAICHYKIYGEVMTPQQHSNSTNCSLCHWGPNIEYQGTVQDKPIEHTTNMTRVSCFECHTNRTMIEKTEKLIYYINSSMYNESVHVNRPGTNCTECHNQYHPPPEYTWKWCECCHSYQADPINESDRHNVTADPANYSINLSGTLTPVLNIINCTICHDATAYDNAKANFNASAERNCRYCHSYPDR